MDPDAPAAAARARADSLHVSIEEIRKIANSTFGDLQDDTQTEKQRFSKADVGQGSFTSYPVAQSLATQHQAAYAVFSNTIQGVLHDLENFQTALLDSAKEYENTDDAAAAALSAVRPQVHGRAHPQHPEHLRTTRVTIKAMLWKLPRPHQDLAAAQPRSESRRGPRPRTASTDRERSSRLLLRTNPPSDVPAPASVQPPCWWLRWSVRRRRLRRRRPIRGGSPLSTWKMRTRRPPARA